MLNYISANSDGIYVYLETEHVLHFMLELFQLTILLCDYKDTSRRFEFIGLEASEPSTLVDNAMWHDRHVVDRC